MKVQVTLLEVAKKLNPVTLKSSIANKFNCKKVSQQICSLTRKNVNKINEKLKVSVILAQQEDGKVNPASQVYVNKKMELMPEIGISSELIRIKSSTTKQQMQKLIQKLNNDNQTTSVLIQLPFPKIFKFDIHDIINQIKKEKNVDGFSYFQTEKPNILNPKVLKPPTALGITALLSYYDVQTQGKNIVIIGKGALVGAPLTRLLQSYPFNATVTTCDIFTQNLKQITKKADIVISACGQAQIIKHQDIKQGAILIDAGINQIIPAQIENFIQMNAIQIQKIVKNTKRKIIGDISSCAYHKAKLYKSVPGGVGLLTVSTLAFNVLNSYYLQRNLPTLNLNQQLKLKNTLNNYTERFFTKKSFPKVMLLSSAYNGLTQRIDRTLSDIGYNVYFQVASSEQAMRKGVSEFQPDIIICPTLMKAIPEDIYKNIKCLIVHPGIKGDRGPSSIDWAILNNEPGWGVTLLQADKQMDAGDIWATQNFKIYPGQSKVEIYNGSVVKIAQRVILKALNLFESKQFTPQKLDYTNPEVKGQLHRTIKLNDPERTVDWTKQSNNQIMKKALAADTQPGLKVSLTLNGKKLTKFTYGYVEQKTIIAPENIQPGEIFLKKYEAVCVKTIQGAVWIKQMRLPKNAQNPNPFKTPSTIHLGKLSESIKQLQTQVFEQQNQNTFQEITFLKKGDIGVLGFDFYNGAMSTNQCLRLAKTLQKIGEMKDVKILILKGSHKSWSNGINLNVIEAASDPSTESWNNIKAINKVVKSLYKMNDKIIISAMQANAGAGGVFLGLATDYSFAKEGIVLNPHYKNMGLYGSELHTAIAAQKFGFAILEQIKETAKPLIVKEAIELKLIDELQKIEGVEFLDQVLMFSQRLAENKSELKRLILKKFQERKEFFKYKNLQEYQKEELAQMQKDMFENRFQFKEKRQAFVKKLPVKA